MFRATRIIATRPMAPSERGRGRVTSSWFEPDDGQHACRHPDHSGLGNGRDRAWLDLADLRNPGAGTHRGRSLHRHQADIVTVLSPGDAEVTLETTHSGRCLVGGNTTDLIHGRRTRTCGKGGIQTMATASPALGFASDPALPQRDLLLDPDSVAEQLGRISHTTATSSRAACVA
jgi:hypothetical protein